MEYGPDSITYSDLGFISQSKKVFAPEEVSFPDDKCNVVAAAVRYGIVFCGNGSTIKVFQSQSLFNDGEPPPLITINCGSQITHLSTSSDGLTLLVIVLENNKPKALFYEIRGFVPQCESPLPFVVTPLNGARVQAIAWNPMDPCSVAIASSPEDLSILTLKDDKVETKSKALKACALSWSPKGKQLTVGVADGTLALFKPDLTLVRNVKSPPMEGASAVQSITWFSNTEFFIGYKLELEEGGQVLMYVKAPKAQEPKFVVYEFICNENEGPRPATFYQIFIPEWNTLCLASSRACQLGVMGLQGDNWCEFELEEGRKACMHCVNITETTYPMGLAIDFTSRKSFTNKITGKVSGPGPVIYTMSTGGELNIFHTINSKPKMDSLVAIAEALPKTGHRTAEQYGGIANMGISFAKASTPVPAMSKSPFTAPLPSVPSTALKMDGPKEMLSGNSASTLGSSLFGGTVSAPQVKPLMPKFATPVPATPTAGTGLTLGKSSPIQFGGPASNTLFSAPASTTQFSAPTNSTQFSAPASSTQFSAPASSTQFSAPASSTQFSSPSSSTPGLFAQTQENKDVLKFKEIPGVGDGKVVGVTPPALTTPIKSHSPSPAPSIPLPKPLENQASSKPPSPVTFSAKDKELGEVFVNIISNIVAEFEEELRKHNNSDTNYEIGTNEEMANIRTALVEESSWIEQMSSTTKELSNEITQLHSDVLQGFKLREEADAKIAKSKNPRHFSSMQSRQLDPHGRKTLETIRSKYQYLQSQLEEVNTRLHLDWVNYTNAIKSKKKRDLPMSETVYNALMKCHTLRTRQEREVDLLCDRLKTLEVDTLGQSLRVNRKHTNDDMLTNLEKSLSEVKILPSPYISPVKMLPQGKQEKLQKMLAQRNTIPVRKCSTVPKTQIKDLSSYSDLQLPNNLQDASLTLQNNSSFSLNNEASFGPQTYSTPNRGGKVGSLSFAKMSGLGVNGKSSSVLPTTKIGLSLSSQGMAKVSDEGGNGLTLQESSIGKTVAIDVNKDSAIVAADAEHAKPLYEDITPPQTPDTNNKPGIEVKSASPLLALSSLVSKVPTTTAAETALPSSAKSGFANPISFSFKSPTTISPIEVTQKPSLSLSTVSSVSNTDTSKALPQFTTSNLSVGQFLTNLVSTQMTSTSPAIVSTTPSTPLPSVTSSGTSMFSFKGATFGETGNSGLFTPKPSTPSTSMTTEAAKSSFTAVSPTVSLSIFGGSLSGQLSLGVTSAPSPSTTFTVASIKTTTFDTKAFSSITVAEPVKDSKEASATISSSDKSSESGLVTVAHEAPGMAVSKASPSLTGESSGGMFSAIKPSDVFSNSKTSGSGSLFQSTASSTSGSLFAAKTTSTTSVFGTSTVSSTMFKGAETSFSSSLFSGSTTTGSIFGTAKTVDSSSSIFGGVKSNESSGVFGTVKTTESSSIPGAAKTSEGGVFGATTSSSSGSIFGGTLATGSLLGNKLASPLKSTADSSSPSTTLVPANETATTVTSSTSTGSMFSGVSSPTTTTTASVFGGVLSSISTTGSLFNPPNASAGTTFGATSTSSTGAGATFGSGTSTASTFAQPSASSTVTTFGQPVASSAGTTFGQPAGTTFGQPTTSSTGNFGQPATSSPGTTFGQPATSSPGTTFGQPATSSTGTTFGQPATSSPGTTFGQPATSSTSTTFGQPATPSTGTTFGQPSTSSIGAFGQPATSSTGTFGQPATSSTSTFGQPAASSTGTFGQPATSSTGTFGQPSAFGSHSTSASAFGTQTATTVNSGFAATTSSGGSIFGQKTDSVFGQSTQNSSGSLFGGQAATGSVFGGAAQTQSGSVFGASAPQGTSIFGGAATQSSGTSLFGQSVTSANSTSGSAMGFAQSSTVATSPFGSASTTQEASSPFSSTGFGMGTGTTASGGGGGFFSGLGSKPSEENANKNIFGTTSFSNAKPQLSLFGGGQANTAFGGGAAPSTSSFGAGQTNTNSTFGSPGFGAATNSGTGSGEASQSAFGMTTPQKQGFGSNATFGGNAVFGGSPSFGSPPKFGGSPAFGGTAAFGTMGGGGGGGGATTPGNAGGSAGGFGAFASGGGASFGAVASSTPSQSGFGGFSGQTSSAGFGDLAHQTAPGQQQSSFGANQSPFSGGSSFSSWR